MYNTMLMQVIEKARTQGCAVGQIQGRVGKFGFDSVTHQPTILIPMGHRDLLCLVDTAHEYGHFMQFCHWDKDYDLWKNVLRDTPLPILEADAWYRAASLLHELGYDAWEEFITEASRCMGTYYNQEVGLIKAIDKMHVFSMSLRRKIDEVREVTYA